MQDKYKNSYVEKVIELKKKLSEVEEKDDKLVRVLSIPEQYNEIKLVGIKLNTERERIQRMNDEKIKDKLTKYQILYDKIKNNEKSLHIPIIGFKMTFETLLKNKSNLRITELSKTVEKHYNTVIENMKKKVKEVNPSFELTTKSNEEIIDIISNPVIYIPPPQQQPLNDDNLPVKIYEKTTTPQPQQPNDNQSPQIPPQSQPPQTTVELSSTTPTPP